MYGRWCGVGPAGEMRCPEMVAAHMMHDDVMNLVEAGMAGANTAWAETHQRGSTHRNAHGTFNFDDRNIPHSAHFCVPESEFVPRTVTIAHNYRYRRDRRACVAVDDIIRGYYDSISDDDFLK